MISRMSRFKMRLTFTTVWSALIFMPDAISSVMGETPRSSSLLGEQAEDSPSPRERLELPAILFC